MSMQSVVSAAVRSAAPASSHALRVWVAVCVAVLGIALSQGWAGAVSQQGSGHSQSLLPNTAGQTVGIFRSGFEPEENGCASGPDGDDDGLLDPFCIQQFTPPDPAAVAPPINPTVVTDFIDANEFIGLGPTPIQVGLQPDVIERYRAAITRGRVLDEAGNPLSQVLVRVLEHPEYGYTYSRADGYYDLLVNGGGDVVLDFQKPDRLRAQRTVRTPWRDWALVDDVRLLRPDGLMTAVILGPGAPAQFAAGSAVTDEDGTRQAKVFFPAGTSATMTLPNGQQQALPVMHFRATEYTVGDAGPERIPGQLPASSAYTYAVELSADQALAAGATRVDFNQPVGLYVDNFIDFPVGEIVPAGWYDFRAGNWVASDNGRVIKLLGAAQGLAQIDIDGSGAPADAAALLELGITAEERAHLAQSYAIGAELWRTPLEHLTPWDCNWPVVPPLDVEEPTDPDFDDDPNSGGEDDDPHDRIDDPDNPDEAEEDDTTEDPNCGEEQESGSIIYCQSQSLGLRVPVAGTGQSLSYRSDRTEAGTLQSRFALRLTGRSLPASLQRATVDLDILGRRYTRAAATAALPDGRRMFVERRLAFDLNLADAYERSGWQGNLAYQFRMNYHYAPYYVGAANFERAFARFSALPFAGNVELSGRGSSVVVSKVWKPASLPMALSTQWNAKGLGFGGWMLSEIRAFDPASLTLFNGDGSQRRINPANPALEGGVLERGPVIAHLERAARQPTPAGNLLFLFETEEADALLWQRLVERMPNGEERLFARSCVGPNTDARPAGSGPIVCPEGTQLWTRARQHAVDARGRVVLQGEEGLHRVSASGRVETLARQDDAQGLPCGGMNISAIAIQGDQVFLACSGEIHLVDAAGQAMVAGGGSDSGEDVPALQANLGSISAMAAEPNGNLVVAAGNRLRRITAQGRVRTIAGNGSSGDTLEGGLAAEQPIGSVTAIAVSSEGLIQYAEFVGARMRVREIDREARVFTRVGGGIAEWQADEPDRTLARQLRFGAAVVPIPLPDGGVRLLDYGSNRILTYGSTYADRASQTLHLVPEADGSAVLEFDARGRHERTLHPQTGATLRRYHYGPDGLLATIEDGHGKRTEITRTPSAIRITSPFGVQSNYPVGSDGYLAGADLPAGQSWQFVSGVRGLYGSTRTPNGHWKSYDWSPLRRGRLQGNVDAIGQAWLQDPYVVDRRLAKVGVRISPEGRRSHSSRQYNRWNGASEYRSRRDGTSSYSNQAPDGRFFRSNNSGDWVRGESGYDPQLLWSSFAKRVQTPGALVTTRRSATPVGNGALGSVDRTETVSVDGRISTRSYDSTKRLWTVRSPEGRETRTWINPQGQPIRRSVSGLADIEYRYDPQGRLEFVHVGSGAARRSTRMHYDSRGFLEWAEDPLQRRVNYERDGLGRPERIRLPDNRHIDLGWDANSNLKRVVPPGRSAHEFDYTPADRLSDYRPPAADAGGWSTSYPRDRDQALGGVLRPDGRNLNIERQPGSTAIRAINWSGGRREMDMRGGRANAVRDGNGQHLEFDWGGQEMLQAQTWTGPEVAGRVSYSYGSARRLTGVSIQNGASVTYGYDLDSLLTSATVSGTRLDLVRNADNGLLEGTGVGDLTDVWAHNEFAETTAYSASYGGDTVFQASYGRDRLGRIDTRSENAGGVSFADTYAYALSGRLDTVHRGGALASDYGFDDNGNRTTHRIGPASPLRGQGWPCLGALPAGADVTVSGSYDAQDRMSAYGTCTYEYTRNGELTRRVDSATNSTTEYDYDEFGNLRRVVLPDTRVITYHIDGLNRRVGKTINGVRQWGLLYANKLEPVAELDGAGNVVASFIYADRPHVPSLMLKGGQTYRIVSDHLGSVRLVVHLATGAIAQRMSYDEYGNVVEDTNPGFQPFGYAGGIYDRDTGLVRFGARDYDAVAGMWTAKDPIGFRGGLLNLYSYVGVEPINRLDVNGLQVSVNYHSRGTHADGYEYLIGESYRGNHGELSVSGHMAHDGTITDRSWESFDNEWPKRVTPEKLSETLKKHRDYAPGKPIRLFVCDAGKGEDSFAERLKEALGGGNPIIASEFRALLRSDGTGDAYNDLNGNLQMDAGEPSGLWREF
ncbi:RHS repeat-associated core domain-containing protein [Aquimonas sp.]|jgi:RHS repeat-associated protein|uniref:RHS repeat-associated core domain-containing protein n=1 Tax=Aquimonas sp. TaxID=1872588 RepID=UPI0037BEAD5D